MPSRSRAEADLQLPAAGGTRTPSGGTYGDFVPTASAARDPSRGAEMERGAMSPTADFSAPPAHSASAREQRIRAAAFARYQERQGGPGSDLEDWLAAESEVDGGERP